MPKIIFLMCGQLINLAVWFSHKFELCIILSSNIKAIVFNESKNAFVDVGNWNNFSCSLFSDVSSNFSIVEAVFKYIILCIKG